MKRGKLVPRVDSKKRKATRKSRFKMEHKSSSCALVVFLWILFVGTTGYLLFFSPSLLVTSVKIEGLSLIGDEMFRASVTQELGKKYFGFIPRKNFLLLQPKKLEQALKEQYPLIRTVTVGRIFPDSVEIRAEERNTIILWCSADTCSHVLENGSVLPVTTAHQEGINKAHSLILRDESGQGVRFGDGIFTGDFVSLILSLQQQLRERFNIEIENKIALSARFANELRMKTTEGWEIYFSTKVSSDTSLNALELFFEKEISRERSSELYYIDLRTENRIFYRYRNEGGDASEENISEKEVKN